MPPMREPETIHATCVLIGEAGILIRGEAGSGKSTLARQLIHDARQKNLFASLVSDDRTWIVERHGRLLARVVESIAGLIEVRGAGLTAYLNGRIRPSSYAASWCLAFGSRKAQRCPACF
jgi:HPr kinase/phosphorylase